MQFSLQKTLKRTCGAVLFLLCMGSPASALYAAPDRLELTNICPGQLTEQCTIWHYRTGFEPSILDYTGEGQSNKFAQSPWNSIEQFPIWVNKLPDKQIGEMETYTFLAVFKLPKALVAKRGQAGILIGEIGEAFTIYVNGNELIGEGVATDREVLFHRTVRGQVYSIPQGFLKPGRNVVVFKVQGDPRYDHTGFYLAQNYVVGDRATLIDETSDRMGLILIVMYLFVGLYHLLLFIKRPKERHNLFFAVFCINIFVYLMTRHNIIFEDFPLLGPIDTVFIQRIELMAVFLLIPPLGAFFDTFYYNQKVSRTITILYSVYATMALATLVAPIHLAEQYLLRIWQPSALFPIGYGIYHTVAQMRRGNKDARRMFIGLMVLIFCSIFDIVDSLALQTGITVTKYGFSIFIFGIATVLANRFLRVHNQVEELNLTLENRVQERTAQLQESLTEIKDLKVQQDGDYYLTSLLIKPLGGNLSWPGNVKVDIFERQKKQFTFRKWKSEIGGDLSLAQTITLRGRTYTVVLNGDAMGKSIQGAGGALVLGTVFKSTINRTLISSQIQAKRPERWLKDSLVDLQNIFMTFDGTMLISAVLALIDNSNGAMFYINAEHPWVALYRDGRASFIEDDLQLRKIGIGELSGKVRIKTFQLMPGDAIYLGSDGRDDIALESGKNGRVINEDETLFLRRIEEGQGELSQIYEAICRHGQLTDDLSLLKAAYQIPSGNGATEDPKARETEGEPIPRETSTGETPAEPSSIRETPGGVPGDGEHPIGAPPVVSPPAAETQAAETPAGGETTGTVRSGFQNALAASDWPEAQRLLSMLTDLQAATSADYDSLARALNKNGLSQEALELRIQYAECFPLDSGGLYTAAYQCKLARRYQDGIDYGECLRLRTPGDIRNLVNLADCYRLNGQMSRATKICAEAAGLDPDFMPLVKLQQLLPKTQAATS